MIPWAQDGVPIEWHIDLLIYLLKCLVSARISEPDDLGLVNMCSFSGRVEETQDPWDPPLPFEAQGEELTSNTWHPWVLPGEQQPLLLACGIVTDYLLKPEPMGLARALSFLYSLSSLGTTGSFWAWLFSCFVWLFHLRGFPGANTSLICCHSWSGSPFSLHCTHERKLLSQHAQIRQMGYSLLESGILSLFLIPSCRELNILCKIMLLWKHNQWISVTHGTCGNKVEWCRED